MTDKMRIYLDDLRPTPAGIDGSLERPPLAYTHRCYTAQEAIDLLKTGQVEFISFDHDLGETENGTGYDVAAYIEHAVHDGEIPMPDWDVHSANPVGANNINVAMTVAGRHWVNRRKTE